MDNKEKVERFMEEFSGLVEKYRLDLIIVTDSDCHYGVCFGFKDIDTGEIVYKIKGVE